MKSADVCLRNKAKLIREVTRKHYKEGRRGHSMKVVKDAVLKEQITHLSSSSDEENSPTREISSDLDSQQRSPHAHKKSTKTKTRPKQTFIDDSSDDDDFEASKTFQPSKNKNLSLKDLMGKPSSMRADSSRRIEHPFGPGSIK